MTDESVLPPTVVLPNRNPVPSLSQESSTIASMRWENDPLFLQIYMLLGGYQESIDQDGKKILVRNDNGKMNDKGLNVVLSFLRAFVNSSVALTNWTDDQAAELINQKLHQIHSHLMLKKEEYSIDDGDFDFVASIIDPLVFAQANRAVSGWEGKNFHTTTAEHRVQNNDSSPQKSSWAKRIIGQ